jgi:RNA polymerase sigma factor (sigma-70 family)
MAELSHPDPPQSTTPARPGGDRGTAKPYRSAMETVEQSDAQLVSRCRAGDAAAWNEFVERFSRYVYAICSRGFRLDAQDAEDVFQEVFAKAFERLGDLRSDDAVRPWLAQLTRRLCIDRLRSNTRHAPAAGDVDETEVDDALGTIDEAMAVRAALDAVGDPCREILDRFFCRDESYRTIGEALDLAAGTIASRISRCLDKVRAELDGRSRASRPS